MSSPPTPSDIDIVELEVIFGGLRVSARGSAGDTARFLSLLRHAESAFGQPAPVQLQSPSESSFLLVPSPSSSTNPSTHQGQSSLCPNRDELLASFPDCPQDLLAASFGLGGSVSAGRARVSRAWLAGCWAQATLQRQVDSPNVTPALSIANRLYIVLQDPAGVRCTRIFRTARDYFRFVGSPPSGLSVSHAFPSETEGRAFCRAAGVRWDDLQ